VVGMIWLNFTAMGYMLAAVIAFFIIIIDSIMTYINSKLIPEYYTMDNLPWIRLIYKNAEGVFAVFLSIIANLFTLALVFILPIRVTFVVFLLGFWSYRLFHTLTKSWILFKEK
jgi:hypothetical protein